MIFNQWGSELIEKDKSKTYLVSLVVEYIYYFVHENRDLEIYLAGWIILYITLILFTIFNVHGKPYSAGNVGNSFTYLAIDKIEKLFDKPKRDHEKV